MPDLISESIYIAGDNRPYVKVELEITEPCRLERQQRNEPLPNSISGIALIDTGATNSHITKRILQEFRLAPIGSPGVRRSTMDRSAEAAPAEYAYCIRFSIPHIQFSIDSIEVTQAGDWPFVENSEAVAIIGADILRKLILRYDGGNRTVSVDKALVVHG